MSRRPAVPGRGAAPDPAVRRLAVAMTAALGGALALQILASQLPNTWLWGVNAARFLPAPLAWGPWALVALALIAPFGRAFARPAQALGDFAARSGLAPLAGAAAAAALVWALPDRTWFTGDFLLRQTNLDGANLAIEQVYPQALPLDLLLHRTLAQALMRAATLDANTVGRIFGALEAALLAVLALRVPRVLKLEGVAAFACAAAAFWGGWLMLFTGYDKAQTELVVAVAVLAVFGLAALRDGAGLAACGAALAFALAAHRSALALVPGFVLLLGLWHWAHGARGGWRRPDAWLAVALPALALAFVGPRLWRVLTAVDPSNFTAGTVARRGGVFAALATPLHLADVASLALLLSPLLLLALALLVFRAHLLRSREAALLLGLAIPPGLVMLLMHPAEGLFRDSDNFAAAGIALALAGAWAIGETLRGRPALARFAPAIALAAAVPVLQLLALLADPARSMSRIEAFALGPPARPDEERATAWDFLGRRRLDLGDADGASLALARSAEIAPTPRVLRQWAVVEQLRGRVRESRDLYQRIVSRKPDELAGWQGLVMTSWALGDTAAARQAARRVLELDPASLPARRVLENDPRLPPPGSAP